MVQYEVAMPVIDEETYQFSVDVTLAAENITLVFKWLNDVWNLFVTFSDGTVREAGVYPNAVNWKGFTDYRVVFISDYPSIARTAISDSKMYVLDMTA